MQVAGEWITPVASVALFRTHDDFISNRSHHAHGFTLASWDSGVINA